LQSLPIQRASACKRRQLSPTFTSMNLGRTAANLVVPRAGRAATHFAL
jgi:hypothetical protein